MSHIIVIGAGITGVTSAYELAKLGYQVTVIDRHLFPAMKHHLPMVDNFQPVMQKSGIKNLQWPRASNGCLTKMHRYC